MPTRLGDFLMSARVNTLESVFLPELFLQGTLIARGSVCIPQFC